MIEQLAQVHNSSIQVAMERLCSYLPGKSARALIPDALCLACVLLRESPRWRLHPAKAYGMGEVCLCCPEIHILMVFIETEMRCQFQVVSIWRSLPWQTSLRPYREKMLTVHLPLACHNNNDFPHLVIIILDIKKSMNKSSLSCTHSQTHRVLLIQTLGWEDF